MRIERSLERRRIVLRAGLGKGRQTVRCVPGIQERIDMAGGHDWKAARDGSHPGAESWKARIFTDAERTCRPPALRGFIVQHPVD